MTTQTSDINPREVLAVLGISDAETIIPIQGGWATAIWKVEHGGMAYALRLFQVGEEAICQREVLGMAAARDNVPVPQVHATGNWQNRPVMLIAWCAGSTLVSALAARPWQVWQIGVKFGRAQAAIHQITAPESLRQQSKDWITWAETKETTLQTRLRALNLQSDALLHFDYHPMNVMFEDGQVSGVLDWTNVNVGDPRADIARTWAILRFAPVEPGKIPIALVLTLRRILEAAWWRGYQQAAGQHRDMSLFYIWAASATLRDLETKIGQPGVWLKPQHLDKIRTWLAKHKHRAGLA